jgi:hypothetical protein
MPAELLKQFDGRPANAYKQSDAADTLISRKDAAARADRPHLEKLIGQRAD